MSRKSFLALLLSILLVSNGCFGSEEKTQEEQKTKENTETEILPSVEIQKIEAKISEIKLSKLGKVSAEKKAVVNAEVSGRVSDLKVALNDKVKAGETLSRLGGTLNTELTAINSELALQDQALAEAVLGGTIASGQKEIEVMQKNVDNALVNYESALSLEGDTQKLVQEQLEQAEIALAQAKTGYNNNVNVFKKTESASYTGQDNIYDSLLKQTQTALTHLELALDTGDLLFAQKNSKYNVLRGQLKQKTDYSTYIKTEHNFIKSWEEIEDLRETIKEAENNYQNADKVKYAAQAGIDLISKVEDVLIQGDNFLQDIRVPSSLDLQEPISKFNTKFPQDIGSLNADRNAIQQTLNSLSSNYKNNQVQLTTLSGQIKQGAIQIDNAYNTLKQAQINAQSQLNKMNFQVETAKNQYESAQAQLNSLRAKMKIQELQARNGVNQAHKQALTSTAQLNAQEIKAPIDGRVTSIAIEEGEIAAQGQALITIESDAQLKIETSVSEEDLAKIEIGTDVEIINSRGLISKGKVSEIGQAQNGTSLFPVKITVTENNQLRSGTFVRLEFSSTENSEEGYFIPLKSVFFTKTSRKVYIVNEEGLIEERDVTLRRILNKKVEVIKGLQEGDQLIVEGGRQLNPGDKVLSG